jgi:Fe-S-cluster-containing dehydrogenase component
MKSQWTRRRIFVSVFRGVMGLLMLTTARAVRAATRRTLATQSVPKGYDPFAHKWLMALNVDRCIGCGLCVDACKTENHVPQSPTRFRTWIERYLIKQPNPAAGESRGEVLVDSPNGGQHGFPPSGIPADELLRSFYVPKLCNLCEHSPCVQACPVGATFDSPDGVALIDKTHCIGCGFCIQACPYGCRFFSPVTHTAEKCSLCYHRITRGLRPACAEVCPTQARVFGDLKDPDPDTPIRQFLRTNKVQSLKPHLGTGPRVVYAGLDKEVR